MFLSHVATEEEVGARSGVGGDAEAHVLFDMTDSGGPWAGLSRFTESADPPPWTPESREVLFVLEGEVQIEIADGPTLELKAGDMASLPAGVETTWHFAKLPFKEMAVLL